MGALQSNRLIFDNFFNFAAPRIGRNEIIYPKMRNSVVAHLSSPFCFIRYTVSFFCERSFIELNAHNFRKNILDGFLHLHGKVKDLKLKFHDYIYRYIRYLYMYFCWGTIQYNMNLILCFPSSSSFLLFSQHLTNVGGRWWC